MRYLQNIKEAFTEQYVLQQLLASGLQHIYYYSSDTSRMEMDFLIQRDGVLLPIEVKGGQASRLLPFIII